MDETECIVCFTYFDDEDHRPRIMPCGHTNCSKCLEKAIRGNSKMCPKCRTPYTASNVNELIINYTLESLVKSLNISKNTKGDNIPAIAEHKLSVKHSSSETNLPENLPECTEHLLVVSNRCSTHKAWICKSCIEEDHSAEECKIITISEELDNKIALKLSKFYPLQNSFEETLKKSDECKEMYKKLTEENDHEIIRYEALLKRIQEEIHRRKTSKIQLERNYDKFDQNIEVTECKRSSYDQAVEYLKSSKTIREVSKYSVELQNEAIKLQQISDEIENETDLMFQNFITGSDPKLALSLGNHKLSVRDGKTHLHALQAKNTSESPFYNVQFTGEDDSPTTDGILTFLDIAWPGQEPRRVYIKMIGNTARARQHLLLVTGQCGHSYTNLYFKWLNKEGQVGEEIILGPYDGNKASPLLKDVTINDGIRCDIKAGILIGACFDNDIGHSTSNNGLFCIKMRDNPGQTIGTGFGMVTSGLEVLQEIFISDTSREEIKVVDCGLVLF